MYRVSIDVGGTFTDLVSLNEETGSIFNIKTPTTPKHPEKGVINALITLLEKHESSSIKMIGHATTIATNALFGQVDLELPKTAQITTQGFRDIIEIGRQRRAEVYNLFFQRPPTLVQRRFRYEVKEGINSKGEITTDLDLEQLEDIIKDVKNNEISSLSLAFLNSYTNPIHEICSKKIIQKRIPELYISTSHEISNEYREYERFSTVAVNAILMPIIYTYLTNLEKSLSDLGINAPLYVMQSNGGLAKSKIASKKPATIVESGPASGVIAAAWLGKQIGSNNIISFDMGGTTAKAGIVIRGIPEIIPEYEVAGQIHLGRLIKGSGYPVRFPFIDLAECSAGGGTIAKEVNGVLQVGPISAGAKPGPACYGKGGTEATITDANLLLGRLNPESLLNGNMKIYLDLAKKSFENLSEQLGMSTLKAAVAVIRIVNFNMSKILKIVTIERGFNPKDFTLIAFGGAGPMHVCPLAEELFINKIIIPPNPGMFSALGLLTADLFHDYTKPILSSSEKIVPKVIESSYKLLEEEGKQTLLSEGIKLTQHKYQRNIDIRYQGQGYELTLPIEKPIIKSSIKRVIQDFHQKHSHIFGYSDPTEPTEIVNQRLRVIGILEKPSQKKLIKKSSSQIQRTRKVYYESTESWVDTPIMQRNNLNEPNDGPAVIEQYDSTVVIYPGWRFKPDEKGNLILWRSDK